MPAYDFWISDTHSVRWHLPGEPPLGSVLDLGGNYGRVRVVEKRLDGGSDSAGTFTVEPARPNDGEPINDPLHPGQWA